MPPDRLRVNADPLRTLLAARSEELAAEALQAGGQVEAARLEQLGRLQRLVELRNGAAPRAGSRWTIPLLAGVTLAAASAVLFGRVATTEIELELKVSELSFVVPTAQVLSDAMNVASVGVSGLRSVALPGPGGGAQEGAEAST